MQTFLMAFTLAYVSGIGICISFVDTQFSPIVFWIASIIPAITLIVSYLFFSKKIPPFLYILLAMLTGMFFGMARYQDGLFSDSPNHLRHFLDYSQFAETLVIGTINKEPDIREGKTIISVVPEKIYKPKGRENLTSYNPDRRFTKIDGGMIYAQITSDMGDVQYEVQYGDKVRLIANLAPPPPATNPGMFSYRDFLHHQNYFAMAKLKIGYQIKRLGVGDVNALVKFSLDLKKRFLVIIKKTMPFPESAFLGGVQLGCRGGVSKAVQEDFRKSGVSHVLAVSGLHVTIIATMFYIIFSSLKLPKKVFVPIIIAFLLVFTIITGARPSSTRAALMNSLVLIIMTYFNHTLKSSLLFGLSVAAVFVLWTSPLILFEPGFTLSFVAILSLAFITDPVQRFCQNWFKGMKLVAITLEFIVGIIAFSVFSDFFKFRTFVAIYMIINTVILIYAHYLDTKGHTIDVGFEDLPEIVQSFIGAQGAILLGMMWPLSAYYFNQVSMSAPIANFIAIPLIGVIVQVGLIAGILGMIPGPGMALALLLNAGNWLCVKFFLWMAHYFAELFPCPRIPSPTAVHLFIYFFIIGLFCAWPTINLKIKLALKTLKIYGSSARQRPVALAAITSVFTFVIVPGMLYFGTNSNRMKVTVLDVRFGEAVVITAPDGTTALIDAGGLSFKQDDKGQNIEFSQGERTVSAYLLKSRINTLDKVFITSLNLERMGGLKYIFNEYGPSALRKVYSAYDISDYGPTLELDEFADLVESKRVRDNLMNTKNLQIYRCFSEIYKIIKKYNIPVEKVSAGQNITIGKSVTAQILSPHEELFTQSYDDISNNSISMRISHGENSMLILSDVRKESLEWLKNTYGRALSSNILLLPFYNADRDFNPDILDIIKPDQTIASFGFAGMATKKAFGFNVQKILKKKIPLWSTSEQGAVLLVSNKKKWMLETVADNRKKVILAAKSSDLTKNAFLVDSALKNNLIDMQELVIMGPEHEELTSKIDKPVSDNGNLIDTKPDTMNIDKKSDTTSLDTKPDTTSLEKKKNF